MRSQVVSAAKSAAILEAAQRAFLTHGLRGTSMEAIARAAGIAKPTLYAYFPDKETIYRAVIEGLTAGWFDNFATALGGEGDIARRAANALVAKHKGVMQLLAGSPHAVELYFSRDLAAPQLAALEGRITALFEVELAAAGVGRARFVTQLLLAASEGIARRAQSPAEMGPALRLLAERLILPEITG